MLNVNHQATRPAANEVFDKSDTGDLLSSVSSLLRRHLFLMASVLIGCLLLGLLIYLTTPQKFSASALLIIDSRKTQFSQQQQSSSMDLPVDSPTVDSQVEILKSETIALAVIKDLHLKDEAEFTGPQGGILPFIMGGISRLFADGTASDYVKERSALERFQKALTIKRVGLSYVIEIGFQSTDAARSARIANALADAYVVDSLEAKYQSSRRAANWLQDRMKELRTQASAAERAVADYKAQNNIVDTGGRLLNEQQLAELNSTLTIVRAQRAEAQARFNQITDILKSEDRGANTLFDATVTDSLRNEVITRLRQQYLDIAARESDWSGRYGQQHLAVINLRNQMREIRRSIANELRRIAETYKSDLEVAKSKEESAQSALNASISQSNDTGQAQIVLRELESNAQSYRALADNFLQLYMVSVQQQSFPITEARLITQASEPLRSSSPKFLLIMILATVGGVGLAFGAAVLRELSDRVFRTPAQIRSILNLECLAVVPEVPALLKMRANIARRRRPSLLRFAGSLFLRGRSDLGRGSKPAGADDNIRSVSNISATSQSGPRIAPYVAEAPFSRFSEAMRSIRMAIDLDYSAAGGNRIVGVTSSLPNEGKSTLSAALAQVIAGSSMRTLLIDADLRNPSLTKSIAPDSRIGLLDVAMGRATLEEAVLKDSLTGLFFLPCCGTSSLSDTSQMLGSLPMQQLFKKIRENYDRVIVDLSPLAPVIDVRATLKILDTYVLIVEWGRTKIEAVAESLNSAPEVSQHLLGVVLNKANLSSLSKYSAYGGDYYYNKHYSRYGYID
jgi:succinoglycan biosynthesis transport protein ExoP